MNVTLQSAEKPAEEGADATLGFEFDNSYARALEGLFVPWQPAPAQAPRLVRLNRSLADELKLDVDALATPQGLAVLSGNRVPRGAQPLAQAYAGHQFGGYSPQLGDGRALLLGEVIDRHGRRRDIAFKGSGRTPFSRGGDGKAALGPVLREYIVGEAMHALNIPTTRALAAVATGESVYRETALPGALLVRVAASHLRVGTFQFAAANGDKTQLRRLADYAIQRHDPAVADSERPYVGLLRAVAGRQAALIARWMGVGFIHGVMNTDNMTISGETIDYGPCAFIEAYDPKAVFSSIDTQGRYAFGNQPGIAQWNLARFAETLLPLLHESSDTAVEIATAVIHAFPARYQAHALAVYRAKLGLEDRADDVGVPALIDDFLKLGLEDRADDVGVPALIDDFLKLLHQHHVDFTLAFRRLGDAAKGDDAPLRALFGDTGGALDDWLSRWRARAATQALDGERRAALMAHANPMYIARNHLVESALAAAVQHDDLAPFERLLSVLREPFAEREADADHAQPAPPQFTAGFRTFCGT